MVMGPTHRAIAAPFGLALAAVMVSEPTVVRIAAGVVVVATSKLPDLDHPRWSGRLRPDAALVRLSARLGYMIRTSRDEYREDLHRGPTHCVEWCLLVGALAAALSLRVPPLAPYALWWGVAVAVGTGTHLLGDVITPSGIAVCATWNYFRHGAVWRRHSLNILYTDSGAEHLLVLPLAWIATGVLALAWLGLFEPVLGALTGWS